LKLKILNTGTFKLDGGATFGVVPKSLWSNEYPADENNLVTLVLRCLLIEMDNRLIIIDTGIGNKQDEKFYRHYNRQGHHSVEKALIQEGYQAHQVTDVIISHMHFDHVGGAVTRNEINFLTPTFPNATYHISAKHWKWALEPNQREKASFLPDNFMPLLENKAIHFIEDEGELFPGIEIRLYNGHTEGLIVPLIQYLGRKIVFTSDFLALTPHISSSWVCGYDTRPLISFEEKDLFLTEALQENYILLFQHDMYTECCELISAEKGIRPGRKFLLDELSAI
jgi:glyoxylase-like metal-dependent hydrolase (beta-lactamase superfamily II)